MLPEPLRHRAAAACHQIAQSLQTAPAAETDTNTGPSSPRWRAQSLSKGAAGVAVLHGILARTEQSEPQTAQSWLRSATREPLAAGGGAGLWYGAASIAFSLLHHAPAAKTAAARQVEDAVMRLARARLANARSRLANRTCPTRREFDVVLGLSGLGAYLLRRDPQDPHLREILQYLVELTEPLPAPNGTDHQVPGWWTTDLPTGHNPSAFANGHADLGMAHGICGPLALLALAWRAGVRVRGQVAAMRQILAWLDQWRQNGPAGPWWPERITLAELRAGQTFLSGPGRPSWCYGTPGIGRAIQLAAIACKDTQRQEEAESALVSCLSDPNQLGQLTDPALCHGWAGAVSCAWFAATDSRSPLLPKLLPELAEHLLEPAPTDHQETEQIGLIEGRAGVAAILHTLSRRDDTGWASCLLIS